MYSVRVEGIPEIAGLDDKRVRKVAAHAVNYAARRARTETARRIREQINLPASWLAPSAGRLRLAQRATTARLAASIRARRRPVSLARFVVSERKGRGGGVWLRVKPGRLTFIPRAFRIRLRAGLELTDEKHNVGLAIRLKPGERIRNKAVQNTVRMRNGLTLLYGPSIDQAFISRTGAGIAQDIEPQIMDWMEGEFHRLWKVRRALK